MGLALQPLTPELAKQLNVPDQKGLVISEVAPDSPAANAGLQEGDVIFKAGDKPVESLADTQRVDAGQVETLTLALLRRGVRAIPGGHWYVNAAHTDALVDETLDVFEDALTEL